MRLITSTGAAVFLAFTVGVITGTGWLILIGLVSALVWSTMARQTTRRPRGWDRS